MPKINHTTPADEVAVELVKQLDAFGVDYAVGGALATGMWSEPRGTLDVDITLFLDPKQPEQCVNFLVAVGCVVDKQQAISALREFGYCRVSLLDCVVDVFLPTLPLYLTAKHRRSTSLLRGREVRFWNAEVMAVLKMMFYREKDSWDLLKVLRAQGTNLDRSWTRQRLVEIYGERDPRLTNWDELCVRADTHT